MADGLNLASISKFDGRNYQQWKFQVKCALRAKGVYDIALGERKKPSTSNTDEESIWSKKDAQAMCIVTSTMDLSQITLIENCETSKEILDKLDGIYALKSETNKMLVHEQFHQYKMTASDSMIQHISKVENLARRIRETGDQISDTAILTKILGTLPTKYRNLRQAWLSLDESKQTIQNLTSRLIDEETNLTSIEVTDSAMVASTSSFANKKTGKTRITCYNCHKKGHIARNCRSGRRNPQTRNSQYNQDNRTTSSGSNQGGGISNTNSNYSVSSAFLVENEGSEVAANIRDEIAWTLDGGASSHMTSNRELFSTFENVGEFVVKLGNGQELPVKGIGTIMIECWIAGRWTNSIMTDVWYIPGLKKNLFSEGVITKKGMKIIKKDKEAKIYQNGILRACAVRESNNLYKLLLRTISSEVNVTASGSLKLWHERLGHVNLLVITSTCLEAAPLEISEFTLPVKICLQSQTTPELILKLGMLILEKTKTILMTHCRQVLKEEIHSSLPEPSHLA